MCGITGFVSRSVPDQGALKAMADKIRHRGPDDEGFFVDEHCAIAHRRLSIIDLANGHQPMISQDGKLVLAYNGEVYNFQQLREELIAAHPYYLETIARSKNIPLPTISEAMGHDSENTTRIYLASLDASVVDKANSLILKSL